MIPEEQVNKDKNVGGDLYMFIKLIVMMVTLHGSVHTVCLNLSNWALLLCANNCMSAMS